MTYRQLTESWPIAPTETLAAGGLTALADGPAVLYKLVLNGGSAATTVEYFNGSVTTEDRLLLASSVIADTVELSFDDVGGIPFSSKMYVKVDGTAGVVFSWFQS